MEKNSFLNKIKPWNVLLVFCWILIGGMLQAQEQVILNIDYTQTEVLTNRAVLVLEVNKGENFDAIIRFKGRSLTADVSGTLSANTEVNEQVATVSVSENFNLKTYTFNWNDLNPQARYEYQWSLEASAGWVLETEWIPFETTDGFGVVANQLFELPEEGLIPGDTIGVLKYENSFEKWKKIQTYYKTTFALKPSGELYGWGKNDSNQIGAFSREGEGVVYGQARITREPFTRGNHDYDFDGFMDEDEYLSGTDVFDPNDFPAVDSDGDYLSDAFEEYKGLDPNEPWLGGRLWFDWMYPFEGGNFRNPPNQWWTNYDWDTHNSIWYQDGPNSYNVREDANDIFGVWASDFAHHEWTTFYINKFTGEIFAWGWNELGNQWDKNSNENIGYSYINYPSFFSRIKAPGIKFEKIYTTLNEDDYGFVGNPKSPVGWDNPVVAIDTEGNLYAWGVVDGVIVDYPMQIGQGYKWIDVAVADNIMAIREDGLLFEIGTKIPISTSKIQTDSDGDGVPDIDDPFPWDPNAYLDTDNDGAADNWEEGWMNTDPNDPDTDGDGYLDGEDQLPNDPLYHADNDWDGLPDELDPDDNDWDVDDDGARDGDDADFYDDDPNYINPNRRWDCDRDGVSDEEEWERGSDACTLDTDNDGIEDKLDAFPRSYYYSRDTDGDGLPDELEIVNGSDPNDEDSDDDGHIDGISQATQNSIRGVLNNLDCDIDCNHYEYFWRFWDLNRDCNGDGQITQDEWENESSECIDGVNLRDMYPTDPEAIKNSDWDDLHDGIDDDDDNDGVSDVDEIRLGTNPLRWDDKPQDSDGDNVPDVIEEEKGLDPFNPDSDGDGPWDGWDSWPLDPSLRHDRDLDKLEDWIEEEYYGTDPDNPDTDGDGVNDKDDPFPLEAAYTKDTDEDGLPDALELELGYNPQNKDSDGDGYFDAPCDRDKAVYWTNEYGDSWWDTNWRECDGYWERVDTDGDGLWNDEDDDIDGDGILNEDDNDHYDWWRFNQSTWRGDAFPDNPNEWEDTDGDGIGNNSDDDDDNDGALDVDDDYPLDARYKLNTDKPTLENGGLTDWNNNGIFGEDYGNDGWIDEMDHRHFDFIPDEIDQDDDGDLFLDEDEIFNGTDPLNSKDFPGIGFTDTDQDGVSNNYEISVGSDPNNWDTDGDGISDGWRFPNDHYPNGRPNRILVWEMIDQTATSMANDEYYFYIHGNNQDHEDRIEINYQPTTGTSAQDILNYFKNQINQNNRVKYENSQYTVTLSASVSGSTLFVQTDTPDWNFYYEFTRVILDDGQLVTLERNHQNGHRAHQWKEEILRVNSFEYGHREYRYKEGMVEWDDPELPYLRDMFPNDPNEYWDTDGDGTGDNADNDIDGDGISNKDDEFPFTPSTATVDQTDTDRDGLIDLYDQDDDNDDFLDVDEVFNGTDPLEHGERPKNDIDSDNDGYSDDYEVNVLGSNPNDWDSDDDGVSDGWKYPRYTSNDYPCCGWEYEFFRTREATIPDSDDWSQFENYFYNPFQGIYTSWNANPYFIDAFPNDPNEYWDTDGDGIGDNSDDDIDGDGISNSVDPLPFVNDPNAIADDDGDGNPNYLDNDDNRDGHFDDDINLGGTDTDHDGISDAHENSIGTDPNNWDTDGDGISDGFRFPRNNSGNFWHQTGWYNSPNTLSGFNNRENWNEDGNNWDWYRYYKGRIEWSDQFPLNLYDMFPNDPDEFWDTDGDGIGDNTDDDIDGDGIANAEDDMPWDKDNDGDHDDDGRPDSIDNDDDDDNELDVDELHLGTDPKDRDSNNQNVDPDRDGLSTAYENYLGTDPNDWDSDNDGITDGFKSPDFDWNSNRWYLILQIQNQNATTQPGANFRIELSGDNSDWQDRLEINYQPQSPVSGTALLNYFANKINAVGFVYIDRREDKAYFEALVHQNMLVIRSTDGGTFNNRKVHFNAFSTVTDQNVIYPTPNDYRGWSLGEIYYSLFESPSASNSQWGREYKYYNGQITWNDQYPYLMDMFPNDPNEFWDTDGDGIGDFTDSDIDGDGVTNSNDALPFDSRDSVDTDRDGIADRFDSNIDNDNFLNFDEITNGTDPYVYTEADGGLDTDKDGISDPYEVARGSNPETWDTDGDGVSDGWRYPSTCDHFEWFDGATWEDEFFRERSFDCGENWYYFRKGEIEWNQENGGALFIDAFPTDPNEYWDTDGDGIGDNSDPDIDGDGVSNEVERTPKWNGPAYWDHPTQTHIRSNPFDPDTDGDGYNDGIDGAPIDDKSIKDTDGDGTGDQSDNDIDGDGLTNRQEDQLGLDPANWDSDGDGYSDGCHVPGYQNRDRNNNWQYPFTIKSDQVSRGDRLRLRFNIHGQNWDYAQEVDITADQTMTPEEFALLAKDKLDNYQFPDGYSEFNTTVSGTTVFIVGAPVEEREEWFSYPNEAEDDAGISAGLYNQNFEYGGKILFDASTEENLDLIIKLWHSNESYHQENITIQASESTQPYEIDIPNLDSQINYSDVIIQILQKGKKVNITDFRIRRYRTSNQEEWDNEDPQFYTNNAWGGFKKWEFNDWSSFHVYPEDWSSSVSIFWYDGCQNMNEDKFPLDPNEWMDRDRDTVGDNEDTDDDNDGLSDSEELELGTNPLQEDTDGDWEGDAYDDFPLDATAWKDWDKDGISDYVIKDANGNVINANNRHDAYDRPELGFVVEYLDPDIDNDGLTNIIEDELWYDLQKQENGWDFQLWWRGWNNNIDNDGDGYMDGVDAYPRHDRFHSDSDGDDHPDAWDPDIDGDGWRNKDEELNETDPYDADSFPLEDTDGDKVSDRYELLIKTDLDNPDTDEDGYQDNVDDFPKNPNEWSDYNNNNYGDNLDSNDDDDEFPDWLEELLGTNPKDVNDRRYDIMYPSDDPDGDGIPTYIENERGTNPNEVDSDFDGCDDHWDQMPNDPNGCDDLDGDGIPDEQDDDRDGDGLPNNYEWSAFFRSYWEYPDSDQDGVIDGEDYVPMDKRIQVKEDINASLFDFNQVGNRYWKAISSWNFNQQAGSYAGIDQEGTLFFWGTNFGGLPVQVDEYAEEQWRQGNDYSFPIFEPVPYTSDKKFVDVALGKKFGLAVTDQGEILSWGTNLSSQLAKGTISTYEVPSYPNTSINYVNQISSGDQQAGMINVDGKLRMFGSNDSGQLGTAATNPNTPQELSWEGIDNIKKVIVTESETQILTTTGELWGFGDNTYAQLGRGYRSVRADDYTHKKSIHGDWQDIYASSGKFYGFKNDGSLWVWGKNEKYDLGIGQKSQFEIDPVQVEGVSYSEIKDFTPTRGGFAYITQSGELYGAGENFYSGGWIPLRNPRRIGTDTDWKKFFDTTGARINLIVQKEDNSIWGAGANWQGQLGRPCPENYTKIVGIEMTHPQVYEVNNITLTQNNISIDYLVSINSNIVSLTVSNSALFVNELKNIIENNNTLDALVEVEATPSSDLDNAGSSIQFTAKNLMDVQLSINYTATDSNVTDLSGLVSHSLTTIQEPKFGTATYTIIINGNRVEAAGISEETALTNMLVALNEASNINQDEFSFTVTNSTLFIENVHYNEFAVRYEVLNSSFAHGDILVTNVQDRVFTECNESWLNDLFMIFDPTNQITDISMGLYHTIILKSDGTLWSMGSDGFGELGRNGDSRSAEQIGTATNWSKIKSSERVSFAINTEGEMYGWGHNNYGQLGVGDFSNKQTPTKVETEGNILWRENLGGYDFQIALDADGNAYGWGYKKFGKLGALGKLKADLVGWDVDDSEVQGIVDFDEETDYLIASEELINNLNQIDFENYAISSDVSGTFAKGVTSSRKGIVFDPEGHKSKRTVFRTNPNTPKKQRGGNTTGSGVGKWKVKKKVQAFSGFASISNGDVTSDNTQFNFAVVDVNERPIDIILSSEELTVETEDELTVGTIEVIDPDQDDEITVSLSPNSQNTNVFSVDERGLHIIYSDLVDGEYNIIIRATDFEGLSLEKAFVITIVNNVLDNVEEVESDTPTGGNTNAGPAYDPRYFDTDGDGVTDEIELLAGTDYRDFEDFPTDTDQDGIWDFEDGDLDNDGILNEDDAFPNDPTENADADGDGIGDNTDTDNDNDGVLDVDVNWPNSSFNFDQFPNDPSESSDFDNDGIGDNADQDDDNDGVNDTADAFPLNALEWADTDRDGTGDNSDEDIDGDGYLNIYEQQAGSDPYVASSVPQDLDGDLFPDIIDLDIDGDGILNEFDTAPNFANPDQEYVPNDPNYIEINATQFFSPNGDGINDTWMFPEIQRFPLNQVWVYSSDGELVFSQQSYQNDWGGDYNGGLLPVGSYLYMVDVDGNGTIDFEGWLYLSN
ncbi:MAG: gliding motility-associated C-terminal domain-containing protein [Flavobacteriaceae bacterium]